MSIAAAARALGVSYPHIYTLAERGELHLIRNPLYKRGPVKIPMEDIERLLAKRRAADPPA